MLLIKLINNVFILYIIDINLFLYGIISNNIPISSISDSIILLIKLVLEESLFTPSSKFDSLSNELSRFSNLNGSFEYKLDSFSFLNVARSSNNNCSGDSGNIFTLSDNFEFFGVA
jgi:hypothetical protein